MVCLKVGRSLRRTRTLTPRLQHPNIIRYIGYIRSRKRLYVVLEYCEGSSLEALYLRFGAFSEKLTKRYIIQVLEGLDFLHTQGITHRDVKGRAVCVCGRLA